MAQKDSLKLPHWLPENKQSLKVFDIAFMEVFGKHCRDWIRQVNISIYQY